MPSYQKPAGLSRQEMCNRIAAEFEDGWVVNLGAGIPTLCSNCDFEDKTIIFHSENGVLGYGPLAPVGDEISHLVNAGNDYITLVPETAIIDHAGSFSLIRGGHVNAVVMGAYEVAQNGDLANWKTSGRRGGAIGGAMDLAVGAKRVFIVMEHTTRSGEPRLRRRCALPLTAVGCVSKVITELGLFEIDGDSFRLVEMASGVTVDDVVRLTEGAVQISPELRTIEVRAA